MSWVNSIPIDTRLGQTVRLLATAFFGSTVMGVTSGGIFIAVSGNRYLTPLDLGSSDVRGMYLTAWSFCAVGLAVLAPLCLWRRSRGYRAWRYGGALGLAFLAMLAVWFVPSFVMGFNAPRTGGTFLGNLGMGLGMWLLTSVYAFFFNVVNLPLVVPAIIDAWYAVLNHGTPEQEPAGAARRRRCWLYGLTVVAIVLLCLQGAVSRTP